MMMRSVTDSHATPSRMSVSSFTLLLVTVMRLGDAQSLSGSRFVESPGNVTSSLGKLVVVQCVLRGDGEDQGPLDVIWLKDGQPLELADTNQMQLPVDENGWLVFSELRIEEVQLSDMGSYQCAVSSGEDEVLSMEGHIELEGLPHFSVEPQDLSVVANEELSLLCVAHGPPDPVRVIWLQDGAPLNDLNDPVSLSPSTLTLSGPALTLLHSTLRLFSATFFTTNTLSRHISYNAVAHTLH